MNNSENSLFNNPMVNAARQNMSQEQIDEYARKGREIYEHFDFESGEFLQDIVLNAAEELKITIRSGLHPSYLTEDEKDVLVASYGEEWYKKFGFEKEDLDEIRL